MRTCHLSENVVFIYMGMKITSLWFERNNSAWAKK